MALEWLGYIEFIERFVFRENAALSLPKRVREKAFSMQIDVEIVSTKGDDYLNGKSNPAYGFYGYAVLVLRNMAEIQVPLNQPRQVIYYGRVAEAYVSWYALYLNRVERQWRKMLNITLGLITGAIGIEEPEFPDNDCVQWCGFEELPLREIYIKTREGIQFRTWISWWEPIIRNGDTDCDYDGKSGQIDDTTQDGQGRDDGLPPTGVQPQAALDPSNPFRGLEPISTNQELGEYGNPKGDQLNEPNSENAPQGEGTGTLRWAKIVSILKRDTFPNGCASTRTDTSHYLVNDDSQVVSLVEVGDQVPNGCGRTVASGGWRIAFTGGNPFLIGFSDDRPAVTFERGDVLPPAYTQVFS